MPLSEILKLLEKLAAYSKTIKSLYPDIPWKEMNGMRNILIHEYFDMEADIAWHTAKKHLPKLKEQLESIKLPPT